MKKRILALIILPLLLFAAGEAPITEIPDPMSGWNKPVYAFNEMLTDHLLHPLSIVWRAAIPRPVRGGLSNMADNIRTPLQSLILLLQWEPKKSGLEISRFFINSTAGILGYRDQATKWNIPAQQDATFKSTLACWGMGPGCYVNIPILGPTNGRGSLAMAMDLSVVYGLHRLCLTFGVMNPRVLLEMTPILERAHAAYLMFQAQEYSYDVVKAFTVIADEAHYTPLPAASIPPKKHDPDQSLGALQLRPYNEEFLQWGYAHQFKLPGASAKVHYTCWPRKRYPTPAEPAKVLVLLPGMGTTRGDKGVAALAELFYKQGWSVISFSSSLMKESIAPFQPRRYPGYIIDDAHDYARYIKGALADMEKKHPRSSSDHCTILGYSLGADLALQIAARAPDFPIDRIIALNPPRSIMKATDVIDRCFDLPTTWAPTEKEYTEITRALFHRIANAYVAAQAGNPQAMLQLQLSREESHYLIGLAMKIPLANLLLASEELKLTQNRWSFAQRMKYSWKQYGEEIILPYARTKHPEETVETMEKRLSLDAIQDKLSMDSRIRIVHTTNDFLLQSKDIKWFQDTFGQRLVLLNQGSHLGNLGNADYQKLLISLAQ